jgi:hypothetical protein
MPLLLQIRGCRRWAYRYMGSAEMELLGTDFLVVRATYRQTPPFFVPKCCKRFLRFKDTKAL